MSTPAYLETVEQVVESNDTTDRGLTTAAADLHRTASGNNVIVAVAKESAVRRYLRQFADWMIALLLVSATITAVLGDFSTAAVLVGLVLVNTLIGFVQEYRAEKTMQALERLIDPTSEVMRDGSLVIIPSKDIVVGDVVRLSEGASVPADIRLIECTAFSTNEFALTGESDPTRKNIRHTPSVVPVADRHNMAWAGTTVATGEALGVVVGTGIHTELGRIAELSQSAPKTRSPLQIETAHIAKYVSYAVAVAAVIVLIVGIQSDLPFTAAMLFAVGFACALIPQGLPAEVNTALAAAAGALAKQNALVKQLSAVETLGATHVICTDKTGTLTRNEMTVTELVVGGAVYTATGIGYEPVGTVVPAVDRPDAADRLRAFLTVGVLASNARLMPPVDATTGWKILGDPTEGALIVVAQKAGVVIEQVLADAKEIGELPFDSARKLMTSIRRDKAGVVTAWVKGAPESILAAATSIDEGGTVRAITELDRAALLAQHTERAGRALRNLAFASRVIDDDLAATNDIVLIERELTLLGMVSMIDPLRETVPDAMALVLAAGVRVNIVTGDFALTAEAIARQAGLEGVDGMRVVTGAELALMADAEVLDYALAGGTVFSRVAPEDKVRIVDLVKNSGAVVAVTGDGINDAPALRHANIGVAMGFSGTDVAKQAAEIVLLDDSFATLVGAIRQGRTIYRNITKGVLSCLTSNIAELVVNSASLALVSLFGVPLALNVMQILAIDLLGEIFPIAALGRDPEEGETMREKPRPARVRILNRRSILDILFAGAIIGVLAVTNYLWLYAREGFDPFTATPPNDLLARAMTVTYVTIMVCQLVSIIQRRSVHGFFTRYQFTNPTFWKAMALSVGLMLVIVYVPPVAGFFGTAPLTVFDWGWVLLAAAVFLGLREGWRRLQR